MTKRVTGRTFDVKIRIAVADGDPLRFVGLQVCLNSEQDFELQQKTVTELSFADDVDVVLLPSQPVGSIVDRLSRFRMVRPDLPFIVTASHLDDETILQAVSRGARGCVDERASVDDLARAIRIVHAGSVWAPRRVLATFVDRAHQAQGHGLSAGQKSLTPREKEVLRMLVEGCSNKEIAVPLGIEERTVKAHVAKLMRKVGAANRIVLSVHAVTHSLIHV